MFNNSTIPPVVDQLGREGFRWRSAQQWFLGKPHFRHIAAHWQTEEGYGVSLSQSWQARKRDIVGPLSLLRRSMLHSTVRCPGRKRGQPASDGK